MCLHITHDGANMMTINSEQERGLKREYDSLLTRAERFVEALAQQIDQILSENAISLGFAIERRVKQWPSLLEKIRRQKRGVTSVLEVNDFAGLRIILLFRRDVAAVGRLLSHSLEVVSAEDTAGRLGEKEFGYQSCHYMIRLPQQWLATPSLREFGGMQAEIQVRTTAQHIWAAASHVLQYKSAFSVPATLRRTIYRAAALLETVDLELERVLDERASYLDEMKGMLPSAFLAQRVNADTLRAYSESRFPGMEISATWQEKLLIDLDRDRYRTLRAIDEARWKAEPAVEAYRREAPHLFGTSTDFLTKSLGFVDSGFRRRHPFSPQTVDAFDRLQGLVRKLGYEKGQERQE